MSGTTNLKLGVICAIGASLCFSLNDMVIKFFSGDYALHQVVLTRSLIGMVFTLAILIPLEGGLKNLKTKRPILHILRGFCVVMANMLFFLGLASMPIAEATAVFFIAPLAITAFAVFFLGEKVGLRRWVAVSLGLVGVLIMLKPGSESIRLIALLPAGAAICYALLHTLTRKIGLTESASTMSFYIQLTFIFVSATIGLLVGDGRYHGTGNPSLDFIFRQWTVPSTFDLSLMCVIGITSALGGYLISQAYRVAEANKIAPFEYINMPLAVVWGGLIWGHWPDIPAWIGISLILGAGLYVVFREGQIGKRINKQRPIQ
ncbi:DMT family transporter [Rhodobacteraceae bacterium]|nr:DMT family transporter [Paracoccaceae bacterium]